MTTLRCHPPHSLVTGCLPWVRSFGNNRKKYPKTCVSIPQRRRLRESLTQLLMPLYLGLLPKYFLSVMLDSKKRRKALALTNYTDGDRNHALRLSTGTPCCVAMPGAPKHKQNLPFFHSFFKGSDAYLGQGLPWFS